MTEAPDGRTFANFADVAAYFREEILDGRLAAGADLPSVRRFAEDKGVSPGTVQRAYRELASEGLISSRPRSGRAVAKIPAPVILGGSRSSRVKGGGVLHRAGENVDSFAGQIVAAPADVAELYGIDEGDDILRRRRRYADASGPVSYVESWIPARFKELVPELLDPAPMEQGWHHLMAARTEAAGARREVKERQERIRSHCASAQELAPLGIDTDQPAPVLFRYVHFWDDQDELVDLGVDMYAPGRELLYPRRAI